MNHPSFSLAKKNNCILSLFTLLKFLLLYHSYHYVIIVIREFAINIIAIIIINIIIINIITILFFSYRYIIVSVILINAKHLAYERRHT